MSSLSCTREGCQVSASGKCLEGFDPIEKCPYHATTHAKGEDQEVANVASNFVDLPSGDALSEEQAIEVMREGPTRVVIVAGPLGSGKTTIISSLYEAFLDAPFAGYLFAGSRTLVGFEKRCHDGRVLSGRFVAETTHTSMGDSGRFLHLHLANVERESLIRTHLLMSDISGEQFKKIRDSSAAVQELVALKRADHLCLVLDGEKIIDPAQRHSAQNDTRSILRSIIEGRVLSPYCKIEVVFAKWDIVAKALQGVQKEPLEIFLRRVRSAFSEAAPTLNIQFHEVAARPQNKGVPFAHGVPTLLRAWLQESAEPELIPLYLPSPTNAKREISRLPAAILASQNLHGLYDVRWI